MGEIQLAWRVLLTHALAGARRFGAPHRSFFGAAEIVRIKM
jgi:hypothetical protein